jgi:hypothetical protein
MISPACHQVMLFAMARKILKPGFPMSEKRSPMGALLEMD